MVVLLDLALALMVVAGALFLGATAVALYKETTKNDENTKRK